VLDSSQNLIGQVGN